mmetsp:Transcript_6495/g.14280  ORF Transcript_6495/g.14280 Transcript_6495/m.14280 type:complete len:215 (-) Transcript_6495:1013-1657(-)
MIGSVFQTCRKSFPLVFRRVKTDTLATEQQPVSSITAREISGDEKKGLLLTSLKSYINPVATNDSAVSDLSLSRSPLSLLEEACSKIHRPTGTTLCMLSPPVLLSGESLTGRQCESSRLQMSRSFALSLAPIPSSLKCARAMVVHIEASSIAKVSSSIATVSRVFSLDANDAIWLTSPTNSCNLSTGGAGARVPQTSALATWLDTSRLSRSRGS